MKKILPPCVILAGGRSSRMGSDKALLEFKEKRLVDYQYAKMSEIFRNVYISCKKDQSFGCDRAKKIYEDSIEHSPLYGIKKAFEALGKREIFFITVDTPFVELRSIQKICNIARNGYGDVYVARTQDKIHPLIGVYKESTLSYVESAIKTRDYKVMRLIESVTNHTIFFEEERKFFNINTVENYKEALGGIE